MAMRQLRQADLPFILDYISPDSSLNLFIAGDVSSIGVETPPVSVFVNEERGRVDSMLLRYCHDYVPYSPYPDFNAESLAEKIKEDPRAKAITGAEKVLERLIPFFPDFIRRDCLMARLDRQEIPEPVLQSDLSFSFVSGENEFLKLSALYLEVPEFGYRDLCLPYIDDLHRVSRNLTSSRDRHLALWHKGHLLGTAGLSAPTGEGAMVTGVAVEEASRGKGYGTSLLQELTRLYFLRGGEYLCLFFDNPVAGRIYHKVGFVDVGPYMMLTRPASPNLKGI